MDEIKALFKLTGPHVDRDEVLVTRQGLRVGRSGDNDLPLDHGEISRHHMRIVWRDANYWVEDLNSSNGVWLNDLRIRPNVPYELKRGDVIRCGPFVFTFLRLIVPEPQAAPPPEAAVPPKGEPLPPRAESTIATPPAASRRLTPLPESNGQTGPSGNGHGNTMSVPMPPRSPSMRPVPAEPHQNGNIVIGVPQDQSSWLDYLPSIYAEDNFTGRYLLIFESILSPIIWMIDNFDMYLSPEVAPAEWLRWIASWFDLILIPELPMERQRAIMSQIGWLFLRRSTPAGLERLLELYFGVKPDIIERVDEPGHFTVQLPLSTSTSSLGRDVAERLIVSQKPAFASFTLEIT